MRAFETINTTAWMKIMIEDNDFDYVTMEDRSVHFIGEASSKLISDIERVTKLKMTYNDSNLKSFHLEYKLDNDVRVTITLKL
jgi:hypothetical protein